MKYFLPLIFLLLPLLCVAQIFGTVRDENGETLAFASVYIRNSTNGTAANAKGAYKLPVKSGTYEVVFQYIGYKQHIESVQVGEKPLQLNVRMEPSDLQIGEVVITGEDPAYRIMREVIAKRRYYKNKVAEYTCDAYVKGFYKLVDTPKKIFGQEVGDMDGMLDSNGMGVLYLSESVSKVYAQASPKRLKEVMVSSKVSGSDDAFSFNRATFTDFNLYEERLDISRDILSPLADNAFNYYNFKYLGEFKDENGYTINKIQVIPKRSADPTFSGNLYVVDDWWNLSGFTLYLTGAAIKQPVIDTLCITQEFVPVEKPDTWRPLTQITAFKFSILGLKVDGFFNSIFSNYDIHPVFDQDFFTRETFKVENAANERDTTYWSTIRPIPLTLEESVDYVKKDSLQRIWKSETYLDSLDKKGNRFKIGDLLSGYTWSNTYERISLSVPGATQWVQFNTVQGWLFNVRPEFSRYADKQGSRFWRLEGNLNYGFAEQRLRGGLRFQKRFESIRYSTLEVSAGTLAEQFNPSRPVGPLLNSLTTLLLKYNFMKLYEKTFAKVQWSQILTPGLRLIAAAEWNERSALDNHTTYSWYKGNRPYSSNDPITSPGDGPFFPRHQAFILSMEARFRFGETYATYPKLRVYEDSDWPYVYLRYRKAIPGLAGSDVDYDFIQTEIRKSGIKWGLLGYTDISISGGLFLRNKHTEFMDWYHPNRNQTFFGKPANYYRSFLQLPFYAYSTDQPYAEAHLQHHLQGWLLDKIPGLRKLNWKEVFGIAVYTTNQQSQDDSYPGKLPYLEINAGFENIGIKAFRMFRIDVVSSFYGNRYDKTGVVIGVNF